MNEQEGKEISLKAGIKTRTVHVDYLARVEGEGSLYLHMRGGQVECAQLKIFEPPRFFEALLQGRDCLEAPDITSRICGICPVAYQMSAIHAIEQAFGIDIPHHIHALRRLLYCGEWIESHTLHLYMLHAPDFYRCADAIEMSKIYPKELQRGLRIKKAGNALIRMLGGREIHPINVKVGGFYRLPTKEEIQGVIPVLQEALEAAIETVHWVSGFSFPALKRDYECVALVDGKEYPMNRGEIASTKGLKIPVTSFDAHFEERQVPYSTALHAAIKERGSYLVGPMARYNLNRHLLSPLVQETIRSICFEEQCVNPFRSIIVRALEILYACDEALRILREYAWSLESPCVPIERRASVGYAATEAPRGLLVHRYHLNGEGVIEKANIVPPTSQNQRTIEEDLEAFARANTGLSDAELTHLCEQTVRNYDPCISCSAHFLKLERLHG